MRLLIMILLKMWLFIMRQKIKKNYPFLGRSGWANMSTYIVGVPYHTLHPSCSIALIRVTKYFLRVRYTMKTVPLKSCRFFINLKKNIFVTLRPSRALVELNVGEGYTIRIPRNIIGNEPRTHPKQWYKGTLCRSVSLLVMLTLPSEVIWISQQIFICQKIFRLRTSYLILWTMKD